MTVVLLLLALSALIGFGVGTLFRWPAIATSSVGIAVLSSAALQMAASFRRGRLFQEQAHKEPSQDRKGDIGQQQQKPLSTTMS